MNSEEVYKSIRSMVSNHDHIFTNVFVYEWECDQFSVTSSGYVYEIEVKISRSDFFADFKKPKHHFFQSYKKGYGILRGDLSWQGSPKAEFTTFKTLEFKYKYAPNRFFFACPVGLVEPHEVPEYAGLIYRMDSGHARIVKKAPYLHKDPIKPAEMLFTKYMSECLENRFRVKDLEFKLENCRKQLERLKDTTTEKSEYAIL